ncbi:MAG: hypothetical protein ACOCXA_08670 [Planctomycetota bacterium]
MARPTTIGGPRMYLDIEANDNLDEDVIATFRETGPGRRIRHIRLWRQGGWQWCAITGWGEAGPEPARLLPIEESGDGPAMLVVGGGWGLRLSTGAAPAWDLAAADQWPEAFLICRPDVQVAEHMPDQETRSSARMAR